MRYPAVNPRQSVPIPVRLKIHHSFPRDLFLPPSSLRFQATSSLPHHLTMAHDSNSSQMPMDTTFSGLATHESHSPIMDCKKSQKAVSQYFTTAFSPISGALPPTTILAAIPKSGSIVGGQRVSTLSPHPGYPPQFRPTASRNSLLPRSFLI